MKLKTILCERLVQSSWLEDISFYGLRNKLFPGENIITFKVHNNPKTYIVRGMTKHDYVQWLKSPSKGRFFHYLKNKFARGWYDVNPFRITDYSRIRPSNKITWENSKK